MNRNLPKLVYIGDVPVEESFAGSTLLYRLLWNYPADRLLILESNLQGSGNGRRLESVRHERFQMGLPRLLRTRFRTAYASGLAATAHWKTSRLETLLKEFQPEAALTVSHGFSWITARQFAQGRMPLHMIVHDDWQTTTPVSACYRYRLQRHFATAYRGAAECYCISRTMRDSYAEEFGRKGRILPPSRGDAGRQYETPAPNSQRPLTFGYAGTLYSRGYRDLLVRLITDMPDDCRCIVYALDARSAIPTALHDRVTIRDPLPPQRLQEALRMDVDVLFCPSSFRAEERRAMCLNLPSKLVEYTSVGLPILVWGPPDSSPVLWAEEHPGAALIIQDETRQSIDAAVTKLHDKEMRQTLAHRAMEVGLAQFSPDAVRAVFHEGLRNAQMSWAGQIGPTHAESNSEQLRIDSGTPV